MSPAVPVEDLDELVGFRSTAITASPSASRRENPAASAIVSSTNATWPTSMRSWASQSVSARPVTTSSETGWS